MKKIFYNGDFITLEKDTEYKVGAILIEDGFIKKVGTKEEILKCKDDTTQIVDLEGKTLMPAFLDAHSHFTGVASDLLKADLEECRDFKEIQDKLIKFKTVNNIKDGKWIIGCNYDHNNLKEKGHPK